MATHTRGKAIISLSSTHSATEVTLQAHILRTLTSVLPSFEVSPQTWPHIAKLKLTDPDFLTPRSIDIIIGADYYGQIIKPNIIKHSPSMPIAQLSIFGWLIIGPVNSTSSSSCRVHHAIKHDDTALQELLTKFWVQEELPTDTPSTLTPEEQECENHFQTTHTRDSSGRYIVRIPLKSSIQRLGESLTTAQRCLQRQLRRFGRDHEYRQLYHQFMTEYEQLNHMMRAPSTSSEEVCYYLPHHGVLKPSRTTTKLRVVFNGSSPTTSGVSVNDLMYTGPNLLLNISDVLIWIRHYRHIFATDITKMYRQVRVHPEDWNLQRILWIDEHGQEAPYQLTTVTYGAKAAPFLAVRALLQLAEDEGTRFPLALPSLKHGRYVDDIFGGADTVEQLIEIAQQLKELCNAGGFPLAKWHTTHPRVSTAVSAADAPISTVSLDDCATKVLGLNWNSQDDTFAFSTKSASASDIILSEVAQIFDPLGLVSPVVIRAKMLLQELWLHKLSWDDPLPSHVTSRWLTIREDLNSLARLSIPRWLNTWSSSTVDIHGFSDASQFAMAAVIYITVHSSSTDLTTALVCSRTKVAPLKRLTIPRLELSAALILAKLTKYVQATLRARVNFIHLWTDSQVTLTWIKAHPSRWKDYVRNRVSQIQALVPTAHWKHVPGTSNPADCASRGVTTEQLITHTLWWTGPSWLSQSADSWPPQHSASDGLSTMELRPGVSLVVAAPTTDYHWDLIYRYSSLTKLLRLTVVCFRIFSRLRRLPGSSPVTPVSAVDVENPRIFWIRATQSAYFSHEIKMLTSSSPLPINHALNRLTAFIDAQGVIRVGGRLRRSELSFDSKHPPILPRHSRLSSLIIDYAHQRTLHGGTQVTLAFIRQSYWIIGGRAPVKSHILHCVKCARQRGIRAQQLMGQLPLCRVTPSHPFIHTGIDYAGPLTIKAWKGRGSKTHKGWICVFVCLATSAVHLELVSDYSAESFIATYRRFSSRRGIPHTIYSDCGTNFQGAEAILNKMFSQGTREHQAISSVFSQIELSGLSTHQQHPTWVESGRQSSSQ